MFRYVNIHSSFASSTFSVDKGQGDKLTRKECQSINRTRYMRIVFDAFFLVPSFPCLIVCPPSSLMLICDAIYIIALMPMKQLPLSAPDT